MSTYNPDIKIYYGEVKTENRLIPAPDITISLEYNYSNDTIIGYTYVVALNGSITALDLRDLNNGAEIPANPSYGLGAIADHIHKVRNILTQNGSILHIIRASDNKTLLRAKGGILRSVSFDESPNNWNHYASYTASLEFHSIDFVDSTENCSSLFIDPSTYTAGNAGIVDISKFKIKSFQDSWNFSFGENESFSKIKNNELGINLNINNHSFNIQYSISATGKHFFDYTNEDTGESTILPAFEQAKNFVQYRLYEQVTNLIDGVLKNSYTTPCPSGSQGDALNNINVPGGSDGLLKDIGDNNYKIYNEQISCDSSESDGTFSATYNAIVVTTKGNDFWTSDSAQHNVSKTVNRSFKGSSMTTTIGINGTIQGYIEGGIINTPGPISLPNKGSLLIYKDNALNKYNNAKLLLDKIYNENDYASGLGSSGKRDLKYLFKSAIGVTLAELNAPAPSDDPVADPPHPTSFNLTHDYNNGTINYNVEYSSSNTCGKKYQEVSVQISQPTKVIAVFNVPNSNRCPVIQELGTHTAKTVSITIRGIDNSNLGQPAIIDLENELNLANLGCDPGGYLPVNVPAISPNSILTQKQYTKNPMDGSYTISLSYICSTMGCS